MSLRPFYLPPPPPVNPQGKPSTIPPGTRPSTGERASDWIARVVGSWRFIIFQSCLLICWAILNCITLVMHWDPYPFILMNLFLSLQAAYTAPMIMMSQNRQSAKDRWLLRHSVELDVESHRIHQRVLDKLDAIDAKLAAKSDL